MTRDSVLVIDAGTSSLRCHIFDVDGRTVSSSALDWRYVEEPDASIMAMSLDPVWLWKACCQAISQCLSDAPADTADVACVAVTSQRQAVVFLDADGHEIYAGPNMDLRAVFEGAAIDEERKDEIYGITGHLPSFFFAPAKLRWFQQQRPEAYGKIATVLTLADWLAWRLTGVLANEVTLAGEAGLLDVGTRNWCNDLLRSLDLLEQKNTLTGPGEIVGDITQESASLTSIRQAVPVTVAGADTQNGLLGMGVSEPGHVGVVAGWSAPVQMVTARPTFSPESRTWVGCHVVNGLWVAESSAGATGNAYQWLADTLYGDRVDPFLDMSEDAAAVSPGAGGAVSIMGNGAMDMSSLGMAYGGLMFPVPMTSATGKLERKHLTRATLESIAYAIRANIEQLESVSAQKAKSISLGGGMTKTRVFSEILVDVLGREVLLAPHPDVTARGANLCARATLGEYECLAEAAAHERTSAVKRQPDDRNAAEYEERYQEWARLLESLKSIDI